MKVVYSDKRKHFFCKCPFEQRHIPKDAGFKWHQDAHLWFTEDASVAARLEEYCDDQAKKQIARSIIVIQQWTGGLTIPKGLELYDFQKTATEFALARNRSYLALDPGLGKTPIAAVVTATLNIPTLYICPPFLARNTETEYQRWAPNMKVSRFDLGMQFNGPEIVIVPDSMTAKESVMTFMESFVEWHQGKGRKVQLVIDEAHRFKNDSAGRTRAVFGDRYDKGVASFVDRILYLSGTPMPNRPMELYTILSHSAPSTIDYMNKFEFGRKYCAGHKNQFGWDFSGASNIPQLKSRVMGEFMLRYKKSEVLKSLPPKTEEMVIIGDDLSPKLSKLDQKILEVSSPEDLMHGQLSLESEDGEELHISTYRKELGIHKAKAATEYIKYLLEETTESLLVFAIHTDVIAHLKKELDEYEPLVVTGKTAMEARHEYVEIFQKVPERRLFIGNIQACGVGLTLTKASRVVFAEFSWVPADNDQASDRAHRIGQRDNVFVQYLVFKNSIDRSVIETVLSKKKVIERFG